MTAPGTTPTIATGWWPKRSLRVFPTRALLTLTGAAPTVQPAGKLLRPSGAALTLTGAAPVVRDNGHELSPTAASLLLTGYAPQIATALRPAGASLTLTGSTPVVVAGMVLRPAGTSLTLTGSAPVVTNISGLSDDFNRANNTSTIGTDWTNRQNTLGINTNAAYVVTTSGGLSYATHNTAMTADDMEVSIVVGSLQGSGTDHILAVLGSNTTGESALGYFTGTSAFILSQSDWAGTGQAVRATGSSFSYTVGDTLSIRRVGNVYTIRKNGSTITSGTWTDSGSIVPRNGSHRIVGIGSINSSGNYRRLDSFLAQ